MARGCTWLLALLLSGAALLGSGAPAAPSGPVLVGFRYDDYFGPPRSGPDTRLEMERRLFDLLTRQGIVPTVATTPRAEVGPFPPYERLWPLDAPESRERVELLRGLQAAGRVEVAQHGYRHIPAVTDPNLSELVTLPLEEQRRRIHAGKEILEGLLGRPVTFFVPPFNSHSSVTLDALALEGFTGVSSHLQSPATRDDLHYVPQTTEWAHFAAAVTQAAQCPGPSLVVLMIHSYDLEYPGNRGISPGEVESTLQRLRALPGVEFLPLGQIAARYPELTCAAHLRRAAGVRPGRAPAGLGRLTRWALGGRGSWALWPPGVYGLVPWAVQLPLLVGLLFGAGAVGLALRLYPLPRSPRRRVTVRLLTALVLGAVALCAAVAEPHANAPRLLLGAFGGAALVGLWTTYRGRRALPAASEQAHDPGPGG